jgi:hypothetical protein
MAAGLLPKSSGLKIAVYLIVPSHADCNKRTRQCGDAPHRAGSDNYASVETRRLFTRHFCAITTMSLAVRFRSFAQAQIDRRPAQLTSAAKTKPARHAYTISPGTPH